MTDKHEPRTKFAKVRVNDADIKMRKELSAMTGETESEIDRRLWEKEYKKVMEETNDPLFQNPS